MGLDVVYCNCFETGALKEPPPDAVKIVVGADGSLYCQSEDLAVQIRFDGWLRDCACAHRAGVLIHHRIGNMATVGAIRGELDRNPETYPITLSKVVYSGTHAGDWLEGSELGDLRDELRRLENFVCLDALNQEIVDQFRQQMTELVEAALRVNKPIAF